MQEILIRSARLSAAHALCIILAALPFSCADKEERAPQPVSQPVQKKVYGTVTPITGEEHFKAVLDSSAVRLMVIDCYADWCGPCRVLAPLIAELAGEYGGRASFFKLDVERHRGIAAQYRIAGIPYVAFLKNREVVHSITGLAPKQTFAEAIVSFSADGPH